MNFRKIDVSNKELIEVRHRFKQFFESFSEYRDWLTKQSGYKKSGASNSYTLYLARIIVLYEENFNERIENLDDILTYNKLSNLTYFSNFTQYNNSEGRFPNAALKSYKGYLFYSREKLEKFSDFAVEENASLINYNSMDITDTVTKRKEKISNYFGFTYPRDLNENIKAKRLADWTCEYDKNHITFCCEQTNRNFVEAHHLIPMGAQDFFDNTLDFSDYIISLCPTCHRKIHYGVPLEKGKMVRFFFKQRKGLYKKHGIEIEIEDLLQFYSI